jgi:hypothetical protein
VYADDENILGDNISAIEENTQALVNNSKEAGLEIDADKTMHMFMSSQQNARQNYNKMKVKRAFEIVAQCKYLGRSVTNLR